MKKQDKVTKELLAKGKEVVKDFDDSKEVKVVPVKLDVVITEEDHKTIDMVYDAVKELTKTMADFAKENKALAEEIKLKVKAGRF